MRPMDRISQLTLWQGFGAIFLFVGFFVPPALAIDVDLTIDQGVGPDTPRLGKHYGIRQGSHGKGFFK